MIGERRQTGGAMIVLRESRVGEMKMEMVVMSRLGRPRRRPRLTSRLIDARRRGRDWGVVIGVDEGEVGCCLQLTKICGWVL